MPKKNVQKIILFFLLILWQQLLLAAPLQILGVHVNKTENGIVNCDFTLSKSPLYRVFGLSDPPRIVIDFDDATMFGRINHAELLGTPIKSIRTGKHDNNSLRVVLDMTRSLGFQTTTVKDKASGKVHLIISIVAGNVFSEETKAKSKVKQAINEIKPREIKKTKGIKKNVAPVAVATAQKNLKETKTVPAVTYYEVVPTKTAITPTMTVAPVLDSDKETKAKEKVMAIIPIPVPPVETINKTESKFANLNKAAPSSVAVKPTSVESPQGQMPLSETKPTVNAVPLKSQKQMVTPASVSDPKNSVALLEPDIKQKPRNIVVVIDPGHGGKDPGAHGVKGTKEKEVVFIIAKKLQDYLNSQNGYSAILTRDGDYYVDLHERLRIAHANKADIFLSLHADAYKNRLIKGTTLFALSRSGATSEAARWLADRENISELGGKQTKTSNDLRSILFDLAQNASIKSSLLAADAILPSLAMVNKLHTTRIEKASFVVLQSPDIPSLLIETGFISDPDDEQRLKDPLFQEMFVQSLARGIMNYFAHHPPKGTIIGANSDAVAKSNQKISSLSKSIGSTSSSKI